MILITTSLLTTTTADFQNAIFFKRSIQCYNLAEAGISKAIYLLNATGEIKNNENKNNKLGEGGFSFNVKNEGETLTITSFGFIPYERPQMKRTIKFYFIKDGNKYKVKDREYL